MILMWMRYEYAVHWSFEIHRCRQQFDGIVRCVQGPTNIQENAVVAGGDFDAITTDLLRSAMDGKADVRFWIGHC
jgi:hypothetical protein